MVSKNKKVIKRIIFFGRKTVGKSSLINTLIGEEICAVHEDAHAASSFFEKELDFPPYGPVQLVDTTSLDCKYETGKNLLEKTLSELNPNNFVIVVLDARDKLSAEEKNIFHRLKKQAIPFLAAVNKIEHGINSDLINSLRPLNIIHFEISCKENVGIDALKSKITRLLQEQ